MKSFKKIKLLMVMGIGLFLAYATTVFAAGSASLSIEGNSTASVGDNITLNLYVTNVSSDAGGVVSVGGVVKFDTSYLEYVSATGATTPYTMQYQAAKVSSGELKIGGIDNTMEAGITSKTQVLTVTFKALKKGTTTVTFDNGELSDTDAILTGSFGSKTITIGESTPDPSPVDPTPGPVDPTPTKSSDATLTSLGVSGYDLTPAFDSATTSYTLTVPKDADSVNITGAATDSKATVSGTGTKTLSPGANTVSVVVTAEDGTKKTYTITINKEEETTPVITKSSDATLKSLSVTDYSLSPKFSSKTTSYSVSVPSTVSSLDIDAIANDSKATVEVIGNKGFATGVNVVKVKVTAEDGSEKIYTINVTKKSSGSVTPTPTAKSSDNYLKELSVSNGELSPKFVSSTSNYSITIPYDVDKLDLKAIPNNDKATVKVTGNEKLKVGSNVVEIEVIAEDGSSRSYTINITKSAKTSNNKLTDIVIGGGSTSLSPKFSPDTYEYNIEIDEKTNSIDISALTDNTNATVEVTGNKNLQDGNNVILVKVTDESGFTQYYKINAYKKAASGFMLFGVDFPRWMIYTLIALVPVLLILLVLAKRKQEEKQPAPATIEFKPEFNFSSKNGTDDDYVEAGGVLNQNSGIPIDDMKSLEKTAKIDIRDIPTTNLGIEDGMGTGLNKSLMEEYPERVLPNKTAEIPYDPYDDIVTKEELIDALNEKDPKKLKILYEQEMLNREKEKIKAEEAEKEYEYIRGQKNNR